MAYDNWSSKFRKHQVVSHSLTLNSGEVSVEYVVFQQFDPEMSEFHDVHVHWTKAFDFFHLHGHPSVVSVVWTNGTKSFAGWKGVYDKEYRRIYSDGSFEEYRYMIVGLGGGILLEERLHRCTDCGYVEPLADGSIRLALDSQYRCDGCEAARHDIMVGQYDRPGTPYRAG